MTPAKRHQSDDIEFIKVSPKEWIFSGFTPNTWVSIAADTLADALRFSLDGNMYPLRIHNTIIEQHDNGEDFWLLVVDDEAEF